MFKGDAYVKKHISSKHYDKMCKGNIEKYFEEQMFNNYCKDENRFTNQPNNITTFAVGQGNYEGHHKRAIQEKYEQKRKQKKETYVDYDDPQTTTQAKPESSRQMISYDDL